MEGDTSQGDRGYPPLPNDHPPVRVGPYRSGVGCVRTPPPRSVVGVRGDPGKILFLALGRTTTPVGGCRPGVRMSPPLGVVGTCSVGNGGGVEESSSNRKFPVGEISPHPCPTNVHLPSGGWQFAGRKSCGQKVLPKMLVSVLHLPSHAACR